jgi:hypothetical protein
MSEEKKYITFKDLRTVANKNESAPPSTSTPSTPSTSNIPSTPSISSISSNTRDTSTPSTSAPAVENKQPEVEPKSPGRPNQGVAPERDFQRIPNSITRRAIPEGFFRGKSKQVWDYLWSVSRGAIVPSRTVRKSRREIKAGSGLGSMVTVDAALVHLQNLGLVAIKASVGSLVGNEYEVFTPEETITSTASTSSTTSPIQNLVELDVLDSSISSITQTVGNIGTYPSPNTSFKTNTENDDDEAFARFAQIIQNAAKEITGKRVSGAEKEKFAELAELLATELKIAAARTSNVSSIPAFLTEHLRRRLWKTDKKQLIEEGKSEVGSPKASVSPEQARNCPDCGGSGMYYPEGYEKGVAKCRHKRLEMTEQTQAQA